MKKYTPIDIENVPAMLTSYTERWRERDERMDIIDAAVRGDFGLLDEFGDAVDNKSPNMVQVALEDTAEAASIVPSVRVTPSQQSLKDKAAAMERMGTAYLDLSQIELLTIRSLMDLCAYGQLSWVVELDEESGSPVIKWRNPRFCYQEPGWRTMDSTRRALFVRQVYVSQLPEAWQRKIYTHVDKDYPVQSPEWWEDQEITLVEVYTEHEILTSAVYQSTSRTVPSASRRSYIPIELDREETAGGICPVIVAERISLDGQPRGQFDQIVRVMEGHIRLLSTLMDYADQAVYSDVWVKDLIGTMAVGGGSYIQLGPQGAIGRVQPAVSSLQVFEELDRLMEGMHLGGRWPKVRPGEVSQSIASAKFIEASAGMMNTTIRTLHFIMKRAIEQALRVCFVVDKAKGRPRAVSGILRNQQYMIDRDIDDIDLEARVRAEYGMGLGREPAQAMVLGIQAQQAGLVSTEYVQENFEGIQDVELERRRIDVQGLRDMALARLMEGMQNGEVPVSALTKIAKARMNGDDLFDLFDEYIVKPQEEMQQQQITSGLDGQQLMPGAAPAGMLGVAPPPAPPPEELLGGGPGGPPSSIGRTSVPLGGGSFAGVESRMGPAQ
jgi:hypothetical protein